MTEKASVEKVRYLKALGADVVVVPATAKPGTPDHYVETARRIARETPNSFYPDQYSNPNNPEAHYRTTGPELWEQTEGRITHFVAGLGTGGTISGTGRFLKEKNPNIRVVGADPYGSVFKTYKETGRTHEATPYLVEGIGQEIIPANVHIKYVDEIINVTDRDSFELSRQLGRQEGIFCGGSTGTNLAAALKVARDARRDGRRRLHRLRHGRALPDEASLGRVAEGEAPAGAEADDRRAHQHDEGRAREAARRLGRAAPQTVAEVLAQMDEHGVTQLPVIEDGRVGRLACARTACSPKSSATATCSKRPSAQVMEPAFPVVDVDATSTEVTRLLRRNPAVLVEEYGRITGIITRHDMLDVPNFGGR